ncbi:FecR family protein [Sphingomonas sp. M1-B02]|uniref:FecR family protein n=1 Tax=Sphingomonas sp. M1-B02 TaxID=3114300 RepID=UPI00223EEF98|nr:FecR family protein [Sphingomonas sp. S6-11]UZK67858.1 FecR family protein [Sphingomonas sp. S6-11]
MSSAKDQDARLEAAEWYARLQSRAVTHDELERFYAWRSNPSHERAFAELDNIWGQASGLSRDPDIMRALRSVKSQRMSFGTYILGLLRGRARLLWIPGAFAALAVMVTAWAITNQPATYRTGVGERLVVELEDGSRLTLNTATSLSVRLARGERRVELERGQAMFEVAHDPQRPFKVTSDGTSVTALGTVFEVRRDGDQVRVTLVEGRVSVVSAHASSPATLEHPGETMESGAVRVGIRRSDPAVATSWINGKVDLRDVPLASAIAEINRYTSKPIVLDAPAQAQTRISGAFLAGDEDAFAAAVTALLPLQKTVDESGTIRLSERR